MPKRTFLIATTLLALIASGTIASLPSTKSFGCPKTNSDALYLVADGHNPARMRNYKVISSCYRRRCIPAFTGSRSRNVVDFWKKPYRYTSSSSIIISSQPSRYQLGREKLCHHPNRMLSTINDKNQRHESYTCQYATIDPTDKDTSSSLDPKTTNIDFNNPQQIQDLLQDLNQQAREFNQNQELNLNSPKQIANALYGTDTTPTTFTASNNGMNSPSTTTSNRGTSKDVLNRLVNDDNIGHQRDLARIVLQYRELKTMLQKIQKDANSNHVSTAPMSVPTKSVESRSFSTQSTQSTSSPSPTSSKKDYLLTTTTSTTSQDITSNSITSMKDTTKSTYEDMVDILFHKKEVHPSSILATTSKDIINEYWYNPIQQITKPSARTIVSQLNPSCPMGYDPLATPASNFMMNVIDEMNESNSPSTATSTTDTAKPKGSSSTAVTTTAGKKGSLLSYVRDQKQKYPDCVILTRVGEFYESFGIDAILLMEHCGLNAMGGKARAGCPVRNIQATLDCLTSAGFRVAVYEEAADTDANLGGRGASAGSKSRLKNRMLAQIVSSASPTYLYNLILGDSGDTRDTLFSTPSARPYVGVISTSAGYTIVEVSIEERTVRLAERVTKEAVACRLASYPPADPLFYVPSMSEELANKIHSASSNIQNLPFLPSRSDYASDQQISISGSKMDVKVMPPSLYLQRSSDKISDTECAKKCIVSAVLRASENYAGDVSLEDNDETVHLTNADFTLVATTSSDDGYTHTKPLHAESATQLGLMNDPAIPQLVQYLVSDIAPAPTKRLLRRWLLTPPPPIVADSISQLVQILKEESVALPPLSVPPIGKVLSLIRAGQASAQVFLEISSALHATVNVLNLDTANKATRQQSDFIDPLMTILQYESGLHAQQRNLNDRCLDALQIINEVVNVHDLNVAASHKHDEISNFDAVPYAFFERNEATWRGRIRKEACKDAYNTVEIMSKQLAEAVMDDFWDESSQFPIESKLKTPVVQDIFNNLIALKEIPAWVEDSKKYFNPRDRNGKILRNRYTTEKVQDALTSYIDACDEASKDVMMVLQRLSETLCDTGHMPTITQASHTNLILSTAFHHAAQANYLGWELADVSEQGPLIETDIGSKYVVGRFGNLWPYWLDRSEAVLNSFDLNGLFLLTAPNMSGKSTLMRSLAAAALLSCCGLCAPLDSSSKLRRFDSIFVRGASSDVPSENKSAFGAEMEDIAALFRSCGSKSLIAVDELGRGTSPKDGTSLAGAVLEEMASKSMSGIFATHLHAIMNLPISDEASKHIVRKKMVVEDIEGNMKRSGDGVKWTYKLEDGVCTDSLALVTAARFGIPDKILKRAEEFSSHIYQLDCNNGKVNDIEKYTQESMQESSEGYFDAISPTSSKSMNDALQSIIEDVSGVGEIIHIQPFWSSPPSLEGYSCVYVLNLGSQYYVGETDSLSQRLRQHRSRGKKWTSLDCYAIQIEGGKSEARNIESRLIRRLVREGFDMTSVNDGTRIRPSR